MSSIPAREVEAVAMLAVALRQVRERGEQPGTGAVIRHLVGLLPLNVQHDLAVVAKAIGEVVPDNATTFCCASCGRHVHWRFVGGWNGPRRFCEGCAYGGHR